MLSPKARTRAAGIAALASRGWVSLAQFATLIGISYPTALKMLKRGDVTAVPVGGTYRVYSDEIERYQREGNTSGRISRKEPNK